MLSVALVPSRCSFFVFVPQISLGPQTFVVGEHHSRIVHVENGWIVQSPAVAEYTMDNRIFMFASWMYMVLCLSIQIYRPHAERSVRTFEMNSRYQFIHYPHRLHSPT